MKKGLNKKKVIQWILKQRLQDRLPHPEVKPRGTGLLPHQLHLQMHSRSSWTGLMASERFKINILKGWQLCRISLMYFQPSLTASTPTRSTNPLVIPVKKGEIIFRGQQHQQHLRGSVCLRGRSFKNCLSFYFMLFLFMFWIIVDWLWYTVVMVNVCF